MRFISDTEIASLNISPKTCVEWVREALLMKNRCQLPAKISLHPQGTDFINTMPCLLPEEYHRFGCKIVSRIKGSHPSLKSNILLLDSSTGDMLAQMDCDWITSMRTGAVATLAIRALARAGSTVFSFIGLGVIGHATLECFLALYGENPITIRLRRYKNHAEEVIRQFAPRYPAVRFEIADTMEEFVAGADVIVSCITVAESMLVPDTTLFKPGVLIVPVHTRGFQNCDTIFDKVFGDDTDHVKDFQYFSQFRQFGELSDVLSGAIPGRESDEERILSYNIGLGLHDVYFASRIEEMIK